MGLYDRDYSQERFRSMYDNAPQMRIRLPSITPVVKWLLLINITIFFAGLLVRPLAILLEQLFSVYPSSLAMGLQFWRLITYQFLHGSVMHLLFNMLGLFFLGPTLERRFGSAKFLKFYLGCGAAGGLFYLLLVAANFLPGFPMVGASGAILGMLAACAILFPHFVVIFFLFPVPIRVAAFILTFLYILNLLRGGPNAGGDAAHLAGMAAGAVYVLFPMWHTTFKSKTPSSRGEQKATEFHNLQMEVDRILRKVHKYGINSLTHKEKKILQEATRREQMRNEL